MKKYVVRLKNGQIDMCDKDDKGFIVHQSQGKKSYYHPESIASWQEVHEDHFGEIHKTDEEK